VSKTDFSGVFLVARKTQQVASWSRDGVSRGAFATLVVTRPMRDRVKSEINVTLQRISFLSVWIGNTINIFVWDIIENNLYMIAGYSPPGCDL